VDVFEALSTTRAMRRLDPDREVPEDDLWTILEASTKGPSGGNRQQLRWIVVRDRSTKKRLGELYREVWSGYQADVGDDRLADKSVRKNMASAQHLAEHFEDAPVILVACAKRRGDVEAAVYPGVWNLCLAARALGLGTTITTMHKARAAEVRAALGMPDDIEIFAVVPVGYPLGRWGEAKRRPAAETTHWDRWGDQRTRHTNEGETDT
jgi:nitroreductase